MIEIHNPNTISIHDSCPIEIKIILEKYLSENSASIEDFHRRLFTDKRSSQLWIIMNNLDPEVKEKTVFGILDAIAICYKDSLLMEVNFRNKKQMDRIEKKCVAHCLKITSFINELHKTKNISDEIKAELEENIEEYRLGIKASINPLYGVEFLYEESFKGITSLRKKGQKNASQIVLTKMLKEEFKAQLNQPLDRLAQIIPLILRGDETPSNLSSKILRDRARKNK